MEQQDLEKQYPSIKYAYEIGIKSYDWCIHRSDAIDNTIDKLLGWFSSVTLGVITLVITKSKVFTIDYNIWFYISIGLLITIVLLGIYTKVKGSLMLLSPEKLYNENLHKNEFTFKKDVTSWASQAFIHNQSLVNRKGMISVAMIGCFILEIITLAMWVTSVL